MKWQCPFCDTVLESASTPGTTERGASHLLRHHFPELEDRFVREYLGDGEHRDCSHHFEPAGATDDHPGFACPHHGTDQSATDAADLVVGSMESASGGDGRSP